MQVYSSAKFKLAKRAYVHWYEKFDVQIEDISQALDATYDIISEYNSLLL
jgi:predicted transcriptional regulator